MRRALFLALALLLTAAAPFDPLREARVEEHPGARVPLTLPVLDEAGRPTTLTQLARGRVLLLVPVLHNCPNLCGVTLDGLASALHETKLYPGRDLAVVAFGLDPAETPSDARRDLAELAHRHPELAGKIDGTVAPQRTIRAVTAALGYRFAYDPRIRQFAHAAAVAVVTPDGRLSRWLYGLAPEPAEVQAAVAEARAGKTGGWTRQLQLLCYHYDPETGRYSVAIDRVLRGAGLLTALAVGSFVIFARRREQGAGG